MLTRLGKVLVGTIFIFTLPITTIPFLIVWIITGKSLAMEILEWILDI